jgi:hypothetical protein
LIETSPADSVVLVKEVPVENILVEDVPSEDVPVKDILIKEVPVQQVPIMDETEAAPATETVAEDDDNMSVLPADSEAPPKTSGEPIADKDDIIVDSVSPVITEQAVVADLGQTTNECAEATQDENTVSPAGETDASIHVQEDELTSAPAAENDDFQPNELTVVSGAEPIDEARDDGEYYSPLSPTSEVGMMLTRYSRNCSRNY